MVRERGNSCVYGTIDHVAGRFAERPDLGVACHTDDDEIGVVLVARADQPADRIAARPEALGHRFADDGHALAIG